MKSTKNIHAIDFIALAQLSKDSKTAGIIAMLAIDSSRDGQVSLSNKGVIEATGLDRGQVSVALNYLRNSRFMLKDPIADGLYHINGKVLRVCGNDARVDFDYFPEFSAKFEVLDCTKLPRRDNVRKVKKMNKLTDLMIGETLNVK